MKKIIERLIVFFVGVPAVFSLVFWLPFYRHLPLNIVVILFSAVGAVEFSAMLEKKNLRISKIEAFIFGAMAPIAATLNVSFNLHSWIVPTLLMSCALWVLLTCGFSRQEKMESVINRLASCLTVIAYPGFFMYWIVRMNIWENSGAILLYLLIVFANDSAAWLFGMLFGKNNRGIIAASPNKSIAGYIGGLFGSVVISMGALFLFPSVFFVTGSPSSAIMLMAAALGIFTGIFGSLGDLAESAIKRSCDFKDSGNLMLGRGGILDSIDSIAVAAPVFFLLFSIFFANI